MRGARCKIHNQKVAERHNIIIEGTNANSKIKNKINYENQENYCRYQKKNQYQVKIQNYITTTFALGYKQQIFKIIKK